MRIGRRLTGITIAVFAAGALAGLGCHLFRVASTLAPIIADKAYAIECCNDRCVLDLDLSPAKRYVLVVGSLAAGTETHRITLSSSPIEVPSIVPATRLEPWQSPRFVEVAKPRGNLNSGKHHLARAAVNATREMHRDFDIHVTDGSPDDARHYARVPARLVVEGRYVRIFLDSQQCPGELAPNLPVEIAHLFDEQVLPACTARLGNCRDIDEDGKFTILLTPWLRRLQGGRTALGGFTREADFRSDLARPFSNHCEMIYLNSSLQCDRHLHTLLLHEFTHALCFSARAVADAGNARLPSEEDWLNEAIAHISENAGGGDWSNLDYRISRFLNAPNDYPLVIENYYQAGMWRNHGCRGATYLFLRWCEDQFGPDLQSQLIHGPATGKRNLEWVTGKSFEELFRRWKIALYRSGRTAIDGSAESSETNEDGYKSLQLCGPLASWGLAGPRTETWNVDGVREVEVRGTSSAFFELNSGGMDAVRRLSIRGDYGTQLQVSLIALSDNWPTLHAEALWQDESAEPVSKHPDRVTETRKLTVCTNRSDASSHVEMIACERNYGEVREPFCFAGTALQRLGSESATGHSGSRGEVFSLAIPHREIDDVSSPLVVKIVSRDMKGRCSTSWTTIDEEPAPVRLTVLPQTSTNR